MKREVELEELIAFVREQWEGAAAVSRQADAPHLLAVRTALEAYARAFMHAQRNALAQRIGMAVTVPDMDALALELLESVESLPELCSRPKTPRASREQVIPVLVDDECGPGAAARFPRLTGRLRDASVPLLLVGGMVRQKQLEWLRAVVLGAGEEANDLVRWIETEDDADSRGCAKVANMMRSGGVIGVITFPSFMGHQQTQTLLDAGRATSVPVVYAGGSGQGALMSALTEMESRIISSAA